MNVRTEIKYGVLFAGILVPYVLIEHVLGLNTTRLDIGQYTRLAGILIPILGVYFGIRAKRDKDLGGRMTFGEGVKAGALVTVVQTTLTMLWIWLYASVINPSVLPSLTDHIRAQMTAGGAPPEAVEAAVQGIQASYAFPRMQILLWIIGIATGVVFALLFAWILRTKTSFSAAAVTDK